MSVRFVIGRAGSGKTRRFFDLIVQMLRDDPLGTPIFWIVPKQATFTAERELTCLGGLGGFCRARVVSFELLGEEVLAECGGTAVPELTDAGRQMLIGHLLRRNQQSLGYYRTSARHAGLAAQLDAAFAEMERCGRTLEDLDHSIHQLQSDPASVEDSSMLVKLRDLRLLYQQYSDFLGQDRLDPHRRLAQVLACVKQCAMLRGATAFVDAFLDFTEYERQMIVGLAQVCRHVEITMMFDPQSLVLPPARRRPHELSLFHRTEQAYLRLVRALEEAAVQLDPPITLARIDRFQSPSLRQIEKHLFDHRPDICQTVEDIDLVEAPDRRSEVDAAARQIRQLVASGMRYRDILVLARDLEPYHELIEASFAEHGIPRFMDRRRTAAHHPLLQFTVAVSQIALHHWPHDAVISLLKTGLAGLTPDEADELENYVLLHRLRGSAWSEPAPWRYRRALTRGGDDEPSQAEIVELDRIDAMRRRVVDGLRLFVDLAGAQSHSLRRLVDEFLAVLRRFKVPATLRRWMDDAAASGRIEQRAEHEQVWNELSDLLDQMVDVFGDELVGLADFVNILDTAFERFDLALTPPTIDQVLVGAVDRTRSTRPAAVLLLGMNDDQFPRRPTESPILADEERARLTQLGMELDADSRRRLLDERLLGYVALTRASQRLWLSRPLADETMRPCAPSPFWTLLRQQFPTLSVQAAPREASGGLDSIGTPRQLVTSLMRFVQKLGDERDGACAPAWAALYHWLAGREARDDAIDAVQRRSWKALSYTNEARLLPETAARMFVSPLRASVSRIETFAACPFKHFARYGLRLEEREEPQVTALDLGNVYHGILEQVVRQMVQRRIDWSAHDPAQTDALIRQYAQQIGQELRGELMLSTARNQYLLRRVEHTMRLVMASQAAVGTRGSLKPFRTELCFGIGDDSLPPLELLTPAGHKLVLRGRIDRVDLSADQAAAVFDYKLQGDRLDLSWVHHGLSLQLLTYLLVLQNAGHRLAGKPLTPIAAFYVTLLRKIESRNHPDEAISADDSQFDLKDKPRGILDASQLGRLDTQLISGRSQVYSASINRDGQLGHRDSTDTTTPEEFAAMLRLVRRKLGELADQILAGAIDVAPFRIGDESPCASCEYRSVCRFDLAVNRYHMLPWMSRQRVLELALKEAGGGE